MRDYQEHLEDERLRLFVWFTEVEGLSQLDAHKRSGYTAKNDNVLSVKGTNMKDTKAYKIIKGFLEDYTATKTLSRAEAEDLIGTEDELEAALWKIIRSTAQPTSRVSAAGLITKIHETDGESSHEKFARTYFKLLNPLSVTTYRWYFGEDTYLQYFPTDPLGLDAKDKKVWEKFWEGHPGKLEEARQAVIRRRQEFIGTKTPEGVA